MNLDKFEKAEFTDRLKKINVNDLFFLYDNAEKEILIRNDNPTDEIEKIRLSFLSGEIKNEHEALNQFEKTFSLMIHLVPYMTLVNFSGKLDKEVETRNNNPANIKPDDFTVEKVKTPLVDDDDDNDEGCECEGGLHDDSYTCQYKDCKNCCFDCMDNKQDTLCYEHNYGKV